MIPALYLACVTVLVIVGRLAIREADQAEREERARDEVNSIMDGRLQTKR